MISRRLSSLDRGISCLSVQCRRESVKKCHGAVKNVGSRALLFVRCFGGDVKWRLFNGNVSNICVSHKCLDSRCNKFTRFVKNARTEALSTTKCLEDWFKITPGVVKQSGSKTFFVKYLDEKVCKHFDVKNSDLKATFNVDNFEKATKNISSLINKMVESKMSIKCFDNEAKWSFKDADLKSNEDEVRYRYGEFMCPVEFPRFKCLHGRTKFFHVNSSEVLPCLFSVSKNLGRKEAFLDRETDFNCFDKMKSFDNTWKNLHGRTKFFHVNSSEVLPCLFSVSKNLGRKEVLLDRETDLICFDKMKSFDNTTFTGLKDLLILCCYSVENRMPLISTRTISRGLLSVKRPKLNECVKRTFFDFKAPFRLFSFDGNRPIFKNSSRDLIFVKRKTINQIQKDISKIVGVSGKYVEELPTWDYLNDMIPNHQDQLPIRSMEDSYDEAYLPLETDMGLKDKFTTVIGTVRLGRLLEAMDFFAVWIVLKYISNPFQKEGKPTPYGIVTGHVDNISFLKSLPRVKRDIVLKGHVSYVGLSSLEVYIWMEQLNDNAVWEILTKAYFIMVARNRTNTKSLPVNRLMPKNDNEFKIFNEAQERAAIRKRHDKMSLLKTIPSSDEQDYIHDLFIKSTDVRDKTLSLRSLPENSVWMHSTRTSCNYFPHPENRNFHLTLFGGFIMRSAVEISWITAMYHVKSRPKLIEISNITFDEPIHVGAFLLITGQVVYTTGKYMEIMSACQIEEVTTRKKHTTNTMYFTYQCQNTATKVVPQSYQEAVLLLDGKRHFEHVMSKRKLN